MDFYDISFRIRKKISRYFSYRKYIKSENRESVEKSVVQEILFSIVVPVYRTPQKYLKAMIDSVMTQTYGRWELVLADAGSDGTGKSVNTDQVKAYKDPRIKYFILKSNAGISANTNEAIKAASGDWIVFADHDDTLACTALQRIYEAIQSHPECGYIYTDEDKISASGRRRYDPYFKPDYNPDLLCGMNYISHLSAVRRTVLGEAGLLDPEMDGSQDYDLTLRCVEKLGPEQIVHIPEVLYHWRSAAGSTAKAQENKLYAYEAGRRAIQNHIDRLGIPGEVEELPLHGRYRIRYEWSGKPMVSVIISGEGSEAARSRIRQNTQYDNYEILMEDSIDSARGEYIIYYDSHINPENPTWMTELLDVCQRKDVGAAGAEIIDRKKRIWHAGISVDEAGKKEYRFRGYPCENPGYMGELLVCRDYDAVSEKCMIVRRGLAGKTAAAIINEGYRVVFTPFAKVYYEGEAR